MFKNFTDHYINLKKRLLLQAHLFDIPKIFLNKIEININFQKTFERFKKYEN